MPTDSIDIHILEKIDAFIEDCKSEIQKRKNSLKGKERTNACRDEDLKADGLQKYVSGGRFCFNQCVADCINRNAIESYKASKKRISKKIKGDTNHHASDDDFKKMELLYQEMQRKYRAEELIDCPPIPRNLHILPEALLNSVAQASHHFDKIILKKD